MWQLHWFPLLFWYNPGDMACLLVVLLLSFLGKSPRTSRFYWNARPLYVGIGVTGTVVARPTVVSTALAGLTVATLQLPSSSACCGIALPYGSASRSSRSWRLAWWEGWKVGRLVEVGLEVEVLVASAA